MKIITDNNLISKIKNVLNKEISKSYFIILFTLHFFILTILIYSLLKIGYFFNIDGVDAILLIPYYLLVKYVLTFWFQISSILLGYFGLNLGTNEEIIIPWTILFYLLISLFIVSSLKKKKLDYKILLISIFACWFIVLILSGIFFHAYWGE